MFIPECLKTDKKSFFKLCPGTRQCLSVDFNIVMHHLAVGVIQFLHADWRGNVYIYWSSNFVFYITGKYIHICQLCNQYLWNTYFIHLVRGRSHYYVSHRGGEGESANFYFSYKRGRGIKTIPKKYAELAKYFQFFSDYDKFQPNFLSQLLSFYHTLHILK